MTDRKIEVIVFSISKIFYSLLILFTSFILVRLLSTYDYGIFQQFIVVSRMFIPAVSSIVFNFVFYRFSEKDEELLSKGFALSHLLGVLSFLFSILVGYIILQRVSWIFEIGIAIYVLFVSSVSFYEHYLLSIKEYHRSSLYLIVVSIAFLIFAVLPAIFTKNVVYSIIGLILYAVLRYAWVMGAVWRDIKDIKSAFESILSHIKYLFPLGGTYFSGSLSGSIDKLIISIFRLPSDFAHYVNGVISIPFIQIIVGSLVNALMPEFSESIKDDKDAFIKKWHSSIIFTAIFLYPVIFFLFFFAKHVMVVLFSNNYIDSAFYFRVALFVLFVRVTTYGNLLSLLEKTKELFYITIIDLVLMFFASVIFYKLWGMVGPALAYVVVTYFQIGLFLYVISKEMNIPINKILPYKELFNIFVFSLIISFFVFYLVRLVGPSDDFIVVLFGGILLILFIMLQFVNRLIAYGVVVFLLFFTTLMVFVFNKPIVVAHKGISKIPESIISISESQRLGHKYIECDFHLLADSSVVLTHDPIIYNGSVPNYSIADSIYKALYGMNLTNANDVFDILTESKLVMELKSYRTDNIENGIYLDSIMPYIVNNLVNKNSSKVFYVISFDPDVILSIDERIRRGFLVGTITVEEASKRYHIPKKIVPYFILLKIKKNDLDGMFINKDIYSFPLYILAKLLRLDLYVWTLNKNEKYPADGIIVDIGYE